MSDYLNNLLTRSFAAPSHKDGLVVPRRWNEYEAAPSEISHTPVESSDNVTPERWSERQEIPIQKVVDEPLPTNSNLSAVATNQTANMSALSFPKLASHSEVAPPQQFEAKNMRNVLPLPTEAKVTKPVARRETPLLAGAYTPQLESREVLSPLVEREVLPAPLVLPIPQRVQAKPLEAQRPIKADPPLRNAQVNERLTIVRTAPTKGESIIRPIIAPSIQMPAAAKTAAPVETVINVTIGRVEVRAIQTPATPVRKQPSVAPTMSLDDYLQKRNGGRG